MLWWFDRKTYGRPRGTRSSPDTRTLTPVVARMSQAHRRAHPWANLPRPPRNDEPTDSEPRTAV